jgi:cation:H+ antiporter
MFMGVQLIFCLIGFALLYYGADFLVKGSSSLARSMGITPLVIGLTVVAFGTSAPELVVSLVSVLKGKSMIAVGNVVGSNICNIGLILGISALVSPIRSHANVVRRDIPIMIGISLYLLVLSLDSHLGRLKGLSLVLGLIGYTYLNYSLARKSKKDKEVIHSETPTKETVQVDAIPSLSRQLILISLGIAGVVIGAQLLIDASIAIMSAFGVSEKFIGLTIVAFGSSLPELATSMVAALRREMDISIGNLVGSNVFNILSVLGFSALLRPITIAGGFFGSGLWFDYLVMIAFGGLPYFMMRKTHTVSRINGAVLLFCYGLFMTYLLLRA